MYYYDDFIMQSLSYPNNTERQECDSHDQPKQDTDDQLTRPSRLVNTASDNIILDVAMM